MGGPEPGQQQAAIFNGCQGRSRSAPACVISLSTTALALLLNMLTSKLLPARCCAQTLRAVEQAHFKRIVRIALQ